MSDRGPGSGSGSGLVTLVSIPKDDLSGTARVGLPSSSGQGWCQGGLGRHIFQSHGVSGHDSFRESTIHDHPPEPTLNPYQYHTAYQGNGFPPKAAPMGSKTALVATS